MCGIVAIISKDTRGLYAVDRTLFEEGLVADTVRGMDSTGVFGVSMRNELHLVKQGIDAITFMRSPSYKEWAVKIPNFRAIVGHNRKATSGNINSANAHPFKEGNIVLVHNGMLWNAKELNTEVEVDSHALCHSFATKGAKETLKDVSGAFALVWYDLEKQKMYLWRNSERPLSLIELNDKVVISSELQMMDWILSRDKRINNVKRKGLLQENTLYEIKLNPFSIVEESLSRVYIAPSPVVSEFPHKRVSPYNDSDEIDLAHLEKVANSIKQAPANSSTEIRKLYPFDSEVLFEVGNIDIHTDVPKRYQIAGKVFMPGLPIVNGYIYTKDTDIKVVKSWKDANKIIGEIGTVLGLANGSVCLHLNPKTIRLPGFVKTRFKANLPLIEWSIIAHTQNCHKCHNTLDVQHPERVSVNELRLGEYRVLCGDCLDKEFDKRKRNFPAVLTSKKILALPAIEQNPEPKVPISADMQAVVEAVQHGYTKDTHGS